MQVHRWRCGGHFYGLKYLRYAMLAGELAQLFVPLRVALGILRKNSKNKFPLKFFGNFSEIFQNIFQWPFFSLFDQKGMASGAKNGKSWSANARGAHGSIAISTIWSKRM